MQLYKITRRGAVLYRYEWADGTPVRGPRKQLNPKTNQFESIEKDGQPYKKVAYGTRAGVPGIRDTIKLTPKGARALRHLGLTPVILGIDPDDAVAIAKGADTGGSSGDTGGGPTDIQVPAEWRTMKPGGLSKLACAIQGVPYKMIKKADAIDIIEAYVDAQAEESENEDAVGDAEANA